MIDDATLLRIVLARREQSMAAIELWNGRLELLRSSGDFRQLLEHLRAPVELAGDNCECNNGCNVPCGSNCGTLGIANVERSR